MKTIFNLFILFVLLLIISCTKTTLKDSSIASVNITNAVFGGKTVQLAGNLYNQISNNSFQTLPIIPGENNLYVWPIGDSSHPYFSTTKFVALDKGIYSLFICGTTAATEGVLMQEHLSYLTDSLAAIRFVNLAPNTSTKPLYVTLSTSTGTKDVNDINYKQISDFKNYSAKANDTYTFQIRNDTCASPKLPLSTITLTSTQVPRFAHLTMIIRQNGSSGVAVFQVKNDR